MQHFFTDKVTGEKVPVEPERWVWGVIYNDDSELHQFGSDGTFHQIGEVDQSKVKLACLYKYGDMSKRIDMPFGPGMKLIHKYKRFGLVRDEDTGEREKVCVYMFGYVFDGIEHITYILPDDRMVIYHGQDIDLTLFNI